MYGRREAMILGSASLLAFLGLWEFAAASELINPIFTSRPTAIAAEFVEGYITEGDLWFHALATARIAAVGFVIGVSLGIAFGFLSGKSEKFRYLVEPYLIALYSTPSMAFLPLLIIWFGIGDSPKIVLVALGTMFPVLINTQAGVLAVSSNLIETARSFRASPFQMFWRIILPSSIPYVLAGLRLAIGRALIMVFVAELIISSKGIGFIVANSGATFQTARLFVGILTLTVTGVTLTHLVRVVEERRFRYGG